MTTDQLNTVVGICLPLLIAWLVSIAVPVWGWITAHISQIKDARLRNACLTAAKSVAHTLLQGELLTPAHLAAALAIVHDREPGWPTAAVTPVLQAAMHDVNTAIIQTVAQQQTAAAATPTVIAPTVDYAQLAGSLLQAILPAPTSIVAPVPVPVTPAVVEPPAIVLPAT